MEMSSANASVNAFDETRSVGEIVAERISRAAVLEKYGIDYCCGGSTPFGEACSKVGTPILEVISALRESDSSGDAKDEIDCTLLSLTDLCNHIEETHHAYMKRTLPRLTTLVANTLNAHGANHPDLNDVADTYTALKTEIEAHLMKEEQVLFPIIRNFEADGALPQIGCGVASPIRQMEHEHDNAGEALRRLRRLTNGYTPPADACNTYRAMLDTLAEMEADLHLHIHKENNILFPSAIEITSGC